MRSLSAAVLAAGLAAWSAAPAAAANLTYEITGNCFGTCANAGLSQGALIFGTLTVARDTFIVGGTFDETDLVDFSVTYGVGRTISRATSVGASLVGVWSNDLDTIAAIDLRAATALAPNAGVGIVLMLGSSILSTNAACATAACDAVSWTNAATLNNVALRATPGAAPVPVPPALALALGGCAALGLAARGGRRRRATAPGDTGA
jgi:hypothetical protein